MSEPTRLSVKRKATDDPPDFLLLQGATQTATHVRYVRQRGEDSVKNEDSEVKSAESRENYGPPVEDPASIPPSPTKEQREIIRRVYQLQHAQTAPSSVTGKRKGSEDGVATFVERKKAKRQAPSAAEEQLEYEEATTTAPLKRPGKGTAVKRPVDTTVKPETDADRKRMEALAEYMHQAALEEVERESPPKPVATPKLSGTRSREIHRQRTATNGSMAVDHEVDMDDDNSYVYDTYILAPTTEIGATQVDAQNGYENVGYLIITQGDQSLGQTYLEDDPGEKDWNSDEDDENAEGYYGADYPEDELASDDEFERDAYGYRGHGGSDEEEWAGDTGAYSDDEYDRMMEPFRNKKTAQQFAKYLEAKDDGA